jgi:hypothetical protein
MALRQLFGVGHPAVSLAPIHRLTPLGYQSYCQGWGHMGGLVIEISSSYKNKFY